MSSSKVQGGHQSRLVAGQAHVSTQLMQHRVEASQPPAHEFADKAPKAKMQDRLASHASAAPFGSRQVVQLISAGDAAGPSVHVGPFPAQDSEAATERERLQCKRWGFKSF